MPQGKQGRPSHPHLATSQLVVGLSPAAPCPYLLVLADPVQPAGHVVQAQPHGLLHRHHRELPAVRAVHAGCSDDRPAPLPTVDPVQGPEGRHPALGVPPGLPKPPSRGEHSLGSERCLPSSLPRSGVHRQLFRGHVLPQHPDVAPAVTQPRADGRGVAAGPVQLPREPVHGDAVHLPSICRGRGVNAHSLSSWPQTPALPSPLQESRAGVAGQLSAPPPLCLCTCVEKPCSLPRVVGAEFTLFRQPVVGFPEQVVHQGTGLGLGGEQGSVRLGPHVQKSQVLPDGHQELRGVVCRDGVSRWMGMGRDSGHCLGRAGQPSTPYLPPRRWCRGAACSPGGRSS